MSRFARAYSLFAFVSFSASPLLAADVVNPAFTMAPQWYAATPQTQTAAQPFTNESSPVLSYPATMTTWHPDVPSNPNTNDNTSAWNMPASYQQDAPQPVHQAGNFCAAENDGSFIQQCQYTDQCWNFWDSFNLFGGLEGSKQPQDAGVNANFGTRWAAEWGFPLLADYGIGGQIGTSVNFTNNAVQVFERVGESTRRQQSFTTLGIFQRTDSWRWGIAYDYLYESYYDQFSMSQIRGRIGYAVSPSDEIGFWGTIPTMDGNGEILNIPVTLSPIRQGSIFWQHLFPAGPRTTVWGGISEGHAQANLALGDLNRTGSQFVFGAEVDMPLNNYLSIFGQANFIGPNDTGTVDSFLGIAYYPSGRAFPKNRSEFAPYQSLVNSTTFATDFKRN
jgi:hypothetical protein